MEYLSLMGLDLSGDLDGWTIYQTRRGRLVAYPASPAMKPPTPSQKQQRARFKFAQLQWRSLTTANKKAWEQITNSLSLVMTGQNLFISLQLVDRSSMWPTVVRRTKTTLTYPALVPQ